MTTSIDLNAYLERIAYPGERAPTLATLAAIHVRHTEAIAFENLNPLMGWPVPLDLESLQKKMVRDGRGGYCYEHNLLLKHALEALGFHVTGLLARVLWSAPEGAITARSHMLLRVDLDQPYIVDAGFGGVTLTGPLRLVPGIEQATPHEPFRLVKVDDEFIEEVRIREAWVPLYRFGLQKAFLPDYEVINWYTSTRPETLFVTELLAARPVSDRRYALRNNQFTVHYLNGRTERRILANADEMREILRGPFGLTLPDAPELDAALKRLTAAA
ncbi:MAG: arylamine N-acetyltransferase [Burkholderiales bacterium]|nr:arylamine N-acetyltransferase [Burkholderiales bacterium]